MNRSSRLGALTLWLALHPTASLTAQDVGSTANQWSLAVTGGGSYLLSDLEIVPGIDQNGGWGLEAGIRARRGRAMFGVGYQRFRFDVGPDGSSTVSGIYDASPNGRGWLVGGGFGLGTPPIGRVQLDLGAGVHRVSGNSASGTNASWKGAGPMVEIRLGASVPLTSHAP